MNVCKVPQLALCTEKHVCKQQKKRASGWGLRSGFSYGIDKPRKLVTTTTITTTTTRWCMELPNPEQQITDTRQTCHFFHMNFHNPLNSTV